MVDARIKVFATCLEGREKKDVQRGWGSGAPEDLTREEITLKRGGCLRPRERKGISGHGNSVEDCAEGWNSIPRQETGGLVAAEAQGHGRARSYISSHRLLRDLELQGENSADTWEPWGARRLGGNGRTMRTHSRGWAATTEPAGQGAGRKLL